MKYYLIHYDRNRIEFMKNQFSSHGIDNNVVEWISYPNREDLTDDIINKVYDRDVFKDNNLSIISYDEHKTIPLGIISCSYKHYLCMKDIVEKKLKYGIIMEDNIEFLKDVPSTINQYLQELPDDWDIMFEGDLCNLHAPIENDKYVYKMRHTRGLNFYMVSLKGAKKLIEKIIPFSLNLDNFINLLISENEIKLELYWGERNLVHKINRPSSWL